MAASFRQSVRPSKTGWSSLVDVSHVHIFCVTAPSMLFLFSTPLSTSQHHTRLRKNTPKYHQHNNISLHKILILIMLATLAIGVSYQDSSRGSGDNTTNISRGAATSQPRRPQPPPSPSSTPPVFPRRHRHRKHHLSPCCQLWKHPRVCLWSGPLAFKDMQASVEDTQASVRQTLKRGCDLLRSLSTEDNIDTTGTTPNLANTFSSALTPIIPRFKDLPASLKESSEKVRETKGARGSRKLDG